MLCLSQCSRRIWKAQSRDRQTEPSLFGWAVHTSALFCALTSVRLLSREQLYIGASSEKLMIRCHFRFSKRCCWRLSFAVSLNTSRSFEGTRNSRNVGKYPATQCHILKHLNFQKNRKCITILWDFWNSRGQIWTPMSWDVTPCSVETSVTTRLHSDTSQTTDQCTWLHFHCGFSVLFPQL
jgi:hypothetical protein